MNAAEPVGLSKSERLEFWNAHSTVKPYLESGTVNLDQHLPNEIERRIVTQVLRPESANSTCTGLIEELWQAVGIA